MNDIVSLLAQIQGRATGQMQGGRGDGILQEIPNEKQSLSGLLRFLPLLSRLRRGGQGVTGTNGNQVTGTNGNQVTGTNGNQKPRGGGIPHQLTPEFVELMNTIRQRREAAMNPEYARGLSGSSRRS